MRGRGGVLGAGPELGWGGAWSGEGKVGWPMPPNIAKVKAAWGRAWGGRAVLDQESEGLAPARRREGARDDDGKGLV